MNTEEYVQTLQKQWVCEKWGIDSKTCFALILKMQVEFDRLSRAVKQIV